MRLFTMNLPGNLHEVCRKINERHAARFLFSLHYMDANNLTISVFRFEDYSSYVYFCEKWNLKPMTTAEFFGD